MKTKQLLITAFTLFSVNRVTLAATPSQIAPHPDLQVEPSQETTAMVQELKKKIFELSQTSMQDIEPAHFSIPDYKIAYHELEKNFAKSLKVYLLGISSIQEKFRVSLSRLKALKDQSQIDKSGLFEKLYQTEAMRIIPNFNKEINSTYHGLINNLYTVNDSIHILVDRSGSVARDQVGNRALSRSKVSGRYEGIPMDPVYGDGHKSFFSWDYTEAFQEDITNIFNKCETNACVSALNNDIKSILYFAEQLNQTIDFTNIKLDPIISYPASNNLMITSPIISRSILLAANDLLGDTRTNQKNSIIQLALTRTVEVPTGIALGFLAGTSSAIESMVRSAFKFNLNMLTATIAQPELKLTRMNYLYPIEVVAQTLDYTADVYGSTLPSVDFDVP